MNIRIVSRPPGEAPEAIRSAWIGVTIPLAVETPLRIETVGVLSKPRTKAGLFFARLLGKTKHETGYVVNAQRALELLEAQSPEAADWWRRNAPKAVAPGEFLVFAADCCLEVKN